MRAARSVWGLSLVVPVLLLACSGGRHGGRGDGARADGGGLATDGATTSDAGRSPDAGALPRDGGRGVTPDAGSTLDAGPPGTPAHIEIYSGDGIMTVEGFPGGDVMKVIVTDGAGAPVANVPVTWTVTLGGIGINGDGFPTGPTGTTRTDVDGIARAGFRGEFGSSMTSALDGRVSATCVAGSVEFHVFSTYTPTGAIPTMPATYITTPDSRDLGTIARGAVRAGGVVSIVVHQNGSEMSHGLAGVGMRFIVSDDSTLDTPPVVSCANATEGLRAGGTVFTDATGHATCDLSAPSTPGDYSILIFVGGALRFGPYFLHVS